MYVSINAHACINYINFSKDIIARVIKMITKLHRSNNIIIIKRIKKVLVARAGCCAIQICVVEMVRLKV